jgi:hypothetical protein
MENNKNADGLKIIFKKVSKKLLKITLYSSLFLTLLFITLFGVYYGLSCWAVYEPLMTEKFDSVIWKQSSVKYGRHYPIEKRCGMYHDLTWNHLKKGMSIKEVESLLGEINEWLYCKDKRIKCHNYGMGVCYGNAWSRVPMSLYACFNEKGKLVTYDRDEHCESQGSYSIKTKEQYCFKKCPDSNMGCPTNDCGIDPW